MLISPSEFGLVNKQNSYNEAAVKSHVRFLHIASLLDHLVDEWEDAEECYRLNHTGEAKEEYLQLR